MNSLKSIILMIIFLLVISFLLIKSYQNLGIFMNDGINETFFYSYTKALCDETNFCQDYYVECENGKMIKMISIPRAFVQHPENWTDPRKDKKIYCKN